MRRFALIVAVAVMGLALTAVAPAAPGHRRTFHFTQRIRGAQISAHTSVYLIHGPRIGRGAGIQRVTLDGLSGVDRETTYYGDARVRSHGTFKLSPPDENGISRLTGTGHDTSGSGKLRGFRSRYSLAGSLNVRTRNFRLVLKGTGSLP